MKELNIASVIRVNKRYKRGIISYICDNKLNREFISDRPYLKLVTNVTEIKINKDKEYLSAVMDLYNRKITAYSISKFNYVIINTNNNRFFASLRLTTFIIW